jgi:hypothetical protein
MPAPLRQLDLDDVLAQVGLGIDPGRVGQVQRHPPQPAPQHRRGGSRAAMCLRSAVTKRPL